MDRYESIDQKIAEGYAHIRKKENLEGCNKWLEAWAEINALLSEGAAEDIYDLEEKYGWSEFLSNYVQDAEMELHNAGLVDKAYHARCAAYCQELLQWCGDNESLHTNTRRGMADAYFDSGDTAKCDQLYSEWLGEDPDWGWGYVGWSDNYWFGVDNDQYEKALEILLRGYVRTSLRDKIAVVERLSSVYGEMGEEEKAKEYERIFAVMQRNVAPDSPYYNPSLPRATKIGRNEPCPCGSGKKYKKCCGA